MLVTRYRPQTLGQLTLPDIRIPDWLKDWRVLAAIGAGIALLAALAGGKAAGKRKRKRLLLEGLRHIEERAKIRRQAL